ncbi:MAG: 16S rRNA (cytidine(1402)-2'-O)-methyltransferase [Atopobiaceae bacterium]|jgi:16S rRNA (cytidine1402-2'-O)-methyltransferase|nr:16S rRNA (cytidine(1402)-2'-O)-methyltransferase [Atopobiaceae bacterium]MCI2174237.1 16S rRNA (cytidine(1402)-2'-O)-methyltransferase [Atopobiaceae bacterium]MCI2206878.1 16S rRNA (cytidine(1402)-2'-O)-methyltransferase [Atopobiaceae bacterium]
MGEDVDVTIPDPEGVSNLPAENGEGILSLVGTPIGNLSDVSPRVSATLSAADVVLCEDTRVTGKLMSFLDIHVPLERCDENVIRDRVGAVVSRVEAGERVAFVSDAGMPGVSDPGSVLMDAVLEAGLPTEVVPGPSAVTCAVAASGIPCEHFLFEGFLPRKPGEKDRRLHLLARVPAALVIYESPRRVALTLAAIADVMPSRRVALIRELTKMHEEVMRDSAEELASRVARRVADEPLRGECVIVVEAPSSSELDAMERQATGPAEEDGDTTPETLVRERLAQGAPKSALARQVARRFDMDRGEAYDLVVRLSREG